MIVITNSARFGLHTFLRMCVEAYAPLRGYSGIVEDQYSVWTRDMPEYVAGTPLSFKEVVARSFMLAQLEDYSVTFLGTDGVTFQVNALDGFDYEISDGLSGLVELLQEKCIHLETPRWDTDPIRLDWNSSEMGTYVSNVDIHPAYFMRALIGSVDLESGRSHYELREMRLANMKATNICFHGDERISKRITGEVSVYHCFVEIGAAASMDSFKIDLWSKSSSTPTKVTLSKRGAFISVGDAHSLCQDILLRMSKGEYWKDV